MCRAFVALQMLLSTCAASQKSRPVWLQQLPINCLHRHYKQAPCMSLIFTRLCPLPPPTCFGVARAASSSGSSRSILFQRGVLRTMHMSVMIPVCPPLSNSQAHLRHCLAHAFTSLRHPSSMCFSHCVAAPHGASSLTRAKRIVGMAKCCILNRSQNKVNGHQPLVDLHAASRK